MGNVSATAVSAGVTTIGLLASVAQENVLTWVTVAINIAVLVTNAAIGIYRKWRDRDSDLNDDHDDQGDGENG